MLHFKDQCCAALLHYRNCAKITVRMFEQKSYLVWFWCQCKFYLVGYEYNILTVALFHKNVDWFTMDTG